MERVVARLGHRGMSDAWTAWGSAVEENRSDAEKMQRDLMVESRVDAMQREVQSLEVMFEEKSRAVVQKAAAAVEAERERCRG
eukprot:CAMPEP_0180391934 /NCGR_PEP_ID=MMETSP0989-20121125/32876_1 /TAXON_ID=697907 /ORGANISM="non described non described, Strain CCMP2293" /LENGTH=82 /DNA_ID=CAMNT_0022393575 /DNA_START=1 /DNA_END=245 /DNA_ORIENTATION=+